MSSNRSERKRCAEDEEHAHDTFSCVGIDSITARDSGDKQRCQQNAEDRDETAQRRRSGHTNSRKVGDRFVVSCAVPLCNEDLCCAAPGDHDRRQHDPDRYGNGSSGKSVDRVPTEKSSVRSS